MSFFEFSYPSTSPAQIPKEKHNISASSGADNSDLDVSNTDPEEVQASYESVLRLIATHEKLSSVPSSLREQYSNLQGMGHDMLGSISQLRELARSVTKESQAHRSPAEGSHVKGKSKQKKKK